MLFSEIIEPPKAKKTSDGTQKITDLDFVKSLHKGVNAKVC